MAKTTKARLRELKSNKENLAAALRKNGAGGTKVDGLAALAQKAAATVAVKGMVSEAVISSAGTVFPGDYVRRAREFQSGTEVRFAVEGATVLDAAAMARNPKQTVRAPIVVAFAQGGITKLKAVDYNPATAEWVMGPTINILARALSAATIIPYQTGYGPQYAGTFYLAVLYREDDAGMVQFFNLEGLTLAHQGTDIWADGSPYNVCGDWSPRPYIANGYTSYTCMLAIAYQCAGGENAGKTYVTGIEPAWVWDEAAGKSQLTARLWKTRELTAGACTVGGPAPGGPSVEFTIPTIPTEEYASGVWCLKALRGDGTVFLSVPSADAGGGRRCLELWALRHDGILVDGGPEFAFVPADCKEAVVRGGLPCAAMCGDVWSGGLGVGNALYHAYAVSRIQSGAQKASVALECRLGDSSTLGLHLLYWAEENATYNANIGQMSLCWLWEETVSPTLCLGYGVEDQFRVMAVTVANGKFKDGPPIPMASFSPFARLLALSDTVAAVAYQKDGGGYIKTMKIKDVVMASGVGDADGVAMSGGNPGTTIQVSFCV